MEHGMKTVEVYVKGPGSGRESAIRALETVGLQVTLIKDKLIILYLQRTIVKPVTCTCLTGIDVHTVQ